MSESFKQGGRLGWYLPTASDGYVSLIFSPNKAQFLDGPPDCTQNTRLACFPRTLE